MNILVLTHSYPDSDNRWQGIFIQEQARALSIKHDITVLHFKVDYSHFAPFSNYSFTKKYDGGVTEYQVTINKSFPVINQLKYLASTYRFIKNEILDQKNIDIIHSHLSYPAGFLGSIIQKKTKIPNILTEHSWIWRYFKSWIHKKCIHYALKNSSRIVAVSEALKNNISTFYDRSIEVLPNVVDVEKFSLSKEKISSTLNIGILGGMGNLRKGLDILLQSVALLKQMDLVVHIGGDGILLENFKKISKDLGVYEKCRFYGEISSEDIIRFYSMLDIFVLASRDETFGVVVIEAMASGLPVIATDCGGPREIVTKETGVLVEKENPGELASAILSMSEKIGSYDKCAIRKYVLEKYGRKAFVESISQLYQSVLSEDSIV